MSRSIYLDHAATTPVDQRVVAAMLPYFTDSYGNPSAAHRLGQQAHHAIVVAREQVARVLNCHPSEVVFTGCGSESNNLALRGVLLASRPQRSHVIISAIEHPAIGATCRQLAEQAEAEVTIVPVDGHGRVDVRTVEAALSPRTALISIMYANNEVGTIEPIAEIGALARARGVVMHTDAVQAGGQLPLDVNALNVDLLSLSAHKFYGPKGVGALFVRNGTRLVSTLTGGGQEGGYRSGTENVPYIVGLATALTLAYAERAARNASLARLRDRLVTGVLSSVPAAYLTGHPTERLPNSASFCFDDVPADALLMHLDMQGIAASSGSACHAGALEPSAVLTALGVPRQRALGALRLTLGSKTTDDDIDFVLGLLPGVIRTLRSGSA